MEILISIAAKITEYTVAPIGRHMGYMFSYTCNFQKLASQLKELEGTKGTIERRAYLERRNGKEIEDDVLKWLDEVGKITEEIKQLCEDPNREKVGCSKCSFPNLWQRHQLSSKAKKVANNVSYVIEAGMKFERDEIGFLPPISGVGSTSITSRFVEFESRMSKMKEIMQALTDPKVSILGIYGLGGVGKSTLVDEVATKSKNEKLFDEVVKASITRSPDHRRIQEEIADQLGLQFTEMSVLGRANRLRQRINMEKNILIILDDIWEAIKLEHLGIPCRGTIYMANREMKSQGDRMGFKVLLISRNQDVLQQMEIQKDVKLEAFDENESWTLFEVMAGDIVKDNTYRGIASEVAKKCAGLAIVIVTVARALKSKDIPIWKDALSRLERADNQDLHDITYSALELSYNQLESNEVKALFLLCGVMVPYILFEDLLKYVIGLGIFQHIITVDDARNKLYKLISALKASCLLLEHDDMSGEFIKMHDSIQEVAISVASRDECVFIGKQNFVLKEWPTRDFLKRCPMIILSGCNIQKLPERLDCPELELFVMGGGNSRSLEIPNSFFEGMKKLKVLDLTMMNISSLPTSLCSLTKLETLCFVGCTLGDIAGIGVLKNLKILSLSYSSMVELPIEIGQLTNLGMLDMSNSKIEMISPNVISSLNALEELYMGSASNEWEVGNSAKQSTNAGLAELRQLPNLSALEVQIGEIWNFPRDLSFDKLERFKILIGDAWKWTDSYGTSRTLKLKLPTNIPLEHGIKLLIKRVESLCLDEINGVSNVLYELNEEGFPLLKNLHIQNNAQIQHIIHSMEWNLAHDSFPSLETMELQSLSKLEKLSHGPLSINSLSKLKVIKVKSCQQLKYLFSGSMVKRLSQLVVIVAEECNSMQEVVLVENSSVGDNNVIDTIEFCQLRSLSLQKLPTLDSFFSNEFTKTNGKRLATTSISNPFFNTKVAFPNLETLELNSVNLGKIWDDGQFSATCGIQKLTSLIMKNCGNLKALFSCSMIRSLSNLKQLELSKCHMMEEIIAQEKEEEIKNHIVALEEVRFAKLEKIIVEDMEKLKTIWHHQFDRVKTIEVKKCDKVVCIFPSSMQREYLNLKTLMVHDCNSVKEIFELNANETGCGVDNTELENLTLTELPNLQQIWSVEPEGILNFYNLQVVSVKSCDNLKYLLPFSIATRLQKLDELHVVYCTYMTEVVANNGGHITGIVRFHLNQLTTLRLWGLIRLRGFYTRNHTLYCPSLKKIYVTGCNKLVLFKTQSHRFRERDRDGKLQVTLQQPLFIVEEVIPNLVMLTIDSKSASKIVQGGFSSQLINKLKELWVSQFEDEQATFPHWFLQNVPNLESLSIRGSSFKKIFQNERSVRDNGQSDRATKLKILYLVRLPKLQYICKEGSQVDPALEVLKQLYITDCSNLTNLIPSSVTFSSLEILEVKNCSGLLNLITSTAARSLVKLKSMKIKECNALEEIMKEEGCEAYEDIAFSSLELLELIDLPQLRRFCSSHFLIKFPLLLRVVVKQCPRMEIFSLGDTNTPKLQKVVVEEESNAKWFWKYNLNETIKNMFSNKVAFRSFNHLKLSEFPELKDLWYGQLQNNVFNNLKSVAVHKCDFLLDVLFTSNLLQLLQYLEELEVKDCKSIEIVFDVKGITDKEVVVKQTTQLKKLSLSGLPNLKQIWKKGTSQILSFRNLCEVNVVDCKSLENIFSVPLCQDLVHLEKLDIEWCGVLKEMVAKEEGLMKCMFSFPQLTKIRLMEMAKLKSFYPGKHTLECLSLKNLIIFHCEALKTLAFEHSEFQQLHHADEIDIPAQQALFSVEKVFPNLKSLALNSNDVWALQNSHHQENIFHNINNLILQCFHEAHSVFPNGFLQRFPNLEKLEVNCSSFQALFPLPEKGHHDAGTVMQVKILWLWRLDQLKFIWDKCSLSEPLIQEVESFHTSMPFRNLTILDVEECRQLLYIFTSTMARSLVQLKELRIKNCEMIEDVVHTDEKEAEAEITFENLEYLELSSLPRFRGFCCGKHNFLFPSLMTLIVTKCPKLMVFSFGKIITPALRVVEVGEDRKRWKHDLNTTIKQLFIDQVMHNTQKLQLDSRDVMMICNAQYPDSFFHNMKALNLTLFQEQFVFPSNFLERFIDLEVLEITCSSFETILPRHGAKMPKNIKQLRLSALSQLKYIWSHECQSDSLAQNLEVLAVADCSSLKRLAPSMIFFHNLTVLTVYQCHGMVNLVTSSTARSFVQLTTMRITDCKMIEEIVENGDKSEDKIFFNCLTYLELTNLESLKSFCSKNFTFDFPSLERAVVQNCPKMDTFCPGVLITPMLRAIETEKGYAWEDNLNTTTQHLSLQMDIPEIDCEDIPELEFDATQ